jgi:hypothetical protein
MRRTTKLPRFTLPALYVVFALVCSFALGGGLIVLLFFGVWGAIWSAFAAFANWANRTRRLILKDRGYY